jgi:hypothetical protein
MLTSIDLNTPLKVLTLDFEAGCPTCGKMVSGFFFAATPLFSCDGSKENPHANELWSENDDVSDLQVERTGFANPAAPASLEAQT